jgi:cellulose synthase operon protein YhjU
MGPFALYFLAKLVLHFTGRLLIHPLNNLALALFVSLPASNARLRLAKNLVGWPLALILLYHDSFLPPPARALEALDLVRSFSSGYLMELAGRLFEPSLFIGALALYAVWWLAERKLRVGNLIIALLALIWVMPESWSPLSTGTRSASDRSEPVAEDLDRSARYVSADALDQNVERFHRFEATRRLSYARRAEGAPFDVLILHVCSLSWDDLNAAELNDERLFARFRIVLTRFNSAASYSGPAAIRLLRAHCGQSEQKRLYEYPERSCLLFSGLEDAGFEPHWLMNHDGHFANFFADVARRGGLAVEPDPSNDAAVAAEAFDGSPIYSDYDVLSRWWARRLRNSAERVALYYNTISLHDGNRLRAAPALEGMASYTQRARTLFSDVDRFLQLVEHSGRRAIVVLVAEHGAAVRGDRYQIDGMREIPSPTITEVPVAVAYVGLDDNTHATKRIDDPLSYFGLAELLHRDITDNPFERRRDPADDAQGLPGGPFVAENDQMLVVRVGGRYLMRPPGGRWVPWERLPGQ